MSRYQLDGYAALEDVRCELASFLRSTFRFASPDLDQAVHNLIQEAGLVAPKVVEPTFPYEEPSQAPRTMTELKTANLVHPELVTLLANAEGDAAWAADRPLYSHQIDAIRAHREDKSFVVTSGTGSGKTECFLIPTIDEVLRDADLTRPGIRVLLVYPLNALVNNQMDRLRAIIGSHEKIRFALYTRRLAETEKVAQRKLRASGRKRYPAEVISREELRARPPHIVVTNFSMLEYALVRPADAPLFSPQMVRPRLCVLDEAHVYAGSLAAELTMLLRRAWLRWGLDTPPRGIVTSATMHQGVEDGPERLLQFARDLLSKQPGDVISISGRRVLPKDEAAEVTAPVPNVQVVAAIDLNFPTRRDVRDADGEVHVEFDTSEPARRGADGVLEALGRQCVRGDEPAFDLSKALEPLGWIRKLRRELHEQRAARLDRVAATLFPDESSDVRERATLNVLGALAVARRSAKGLPLLPVRIHAVVRGPHGVFACINVACPETVDRRVGKLFSDHATRCDCGGLILELRVCEGCGQSYLGADVDADDEGLPALQHSVRKLDLFVPGTTWDDGTTIDKPTFIHVNPTGRVAPDGEGMRWVRFAGGRVRGATQQLVDVHCPKCDATIPNGSVLRRIEAGTDAALQVVIDGMYPALPQHPNSGQLHLPGDGRRALLFADNRQVAAALAAKIEESHDIVLARVLLSRSLETALKTSASPETARLQRLQMEALQAGRIEEAQRLMLQLAEAAKKPSASSCSYSELQNALAGDAKLEELSSFHAGAHHDVAQMVITRELARRPARRGNLEAVGAVAMIYAHTIPAPGNADLSTSFSANEWTALVEVVLDVLRTSGFVKPPALSYESRQLLQMNILGKALAKAAGRNDDEDEDDSRKVISLVPAGNRRTRLVEYLEKVLAKRSPPPTVTPLLILDQIWEALVTATRTKPSAVVVDGERLLMPIENLRFTTASRTDQWRCATCKTVWARQVNNVCPTTGCTGVLQKLERGALDARERLVALSRSTMPILGLRTEEHTAQIGVERLEEREQDFKAGKVNVLTSSTTMELGIDIGGLSATLLTNVPPGASNYLQRAGRAGRRAEGTSLVLTYARPRPFDQAAFADPLRPFRDRIVPPVVRLDTDRIIQRHVNAFLLAFFFREYEAQGNVASDPMSALRTVNDFFFRPLANVLAGHADVAERLLALAGAGATLCDAFVAWLRGGRAEQETQSHLKVLVRGTSLEPYSAAQLSMVSATHIGRICDNTRGQSAFLQARIDEEKGRPERSRDDGAITALELQRGDLENAKLLGYLAEEQYLPRYGFPVHVVNLDHRFEPTKKGDRPVEEDDAELRLSRDLSLAINEYAPGADVVAGKHVHRSSGLLRHWSGADVPGVLANRFVALCQACGQLQYGRNEGEIRSPCPTCHEGVPRTIRVLEPSHGFAVQWGDRPKRWISGSRPPLRPVTETAYAARDGQSVVEVSPGLALGYDPEGQILVRAEGQLDPTELPGAGAVQAGTPRAGYGYAICYLCGRAEPEQKPEGKNVPLLSALTNHKRLRGDERCEATTQFWRNTALAGAVRTETLMFQLQGPLQFTADVQGRRWTTTWMVALQLAAGELLGIDSRSFGSLLVPRSTPNGVVHDALLYDQLAGGAGLCRTLLDRWCELLDLVRKRLHCPNPKCTNACHQCLIAFETQRYEDTMRRSELAAFLDQHWDTLTEKPIRDDVEVAALMRGRFELLETVKRAEGSTVTVFSPSLAEDALDEQGWLHPLLLHAEAGGRLRLVLEIVPNPNEDEQRFLARRLSVALESGRCEMFALKPGSLAAFPWKLSISQNAQVFYLDNARDAGLGASWLGDGAIFYPLEEEARRTVVARGEALLSGLSTIAATKLEPPPPSPDMRWQYVPAMEPASRATLAHWLKGPDNESLFARPLLELALADPYLGSDGQLTLLEELCDLARKAGCTKFSVDTYPPRGRGNDVPPDQQRDRIQRAIRNPTWSPRSLPPRGVDRFHKRLLRGTRSDGTKFEVLFERGIDFIYQRDRVNRTTRETFIIVRDPV